MTLVDTNVLLDLVTDDLQWADWSATMLQSLSRETLCVNPVIFSELCVGAETVDEVVDLLEELSIDWKELSLNALFLAAKAFGRYRAREGKKDTPLPDFFIGAHAADESMRILTRDPRRFAFYFPQVELLSPDR